MSGCILATAAATTIITVAIIRSARPPVSLMRVSCAALVGSCRPHANYGLTAEVLCCFEELWCRISGFVRVCAMLQQDCMEILLVCSAEAGTSRLESRSILCRSFGHVEGNARGACARAYVSPAVPMDNAEVRFASTEVSILCSCEQWHLSCPCCTLNVAALSAVGAFLEKGWPRNNQP